MVLQTRRMEGIKAFKVLWLRKYQLADKKKKRGQRRGKEEKKEEMEEGRRKRRKRK